MLRSPFDTGKIPVRDKVIEDMESFQSLCRAGLEVVKKGPTVVIMETRGRSNLWVTARKRLDGDDYFKNDESSGVTIILLNIMNRFGEDIIGFVNIKKIINDELNGDPCVCPEFVELISAKKVTVIGDCLLKHFKRLENSFGGIEGSNYVTLHDLTERWRRHKFEIGEACEVKLNSHEITDSSSTSTRSSKTKPTIKIRTKAFLIGTTPRISVVLNTSMGSTKSFLR